MPDDLIRESTFISFCDNGTLLRAFLCFVIDFDLELLLAPPEPMDAALLEFRSGL